MAFDLLVQAIEQLYRAFEIDHPLEGDQSVFNQSLTDDMYFAHIRACFGAHSVELKSLDGTPPPKKSKDRYFASWSSDAGGDYTVYLYSNKPRDATVPLSLSFAKIHEYTVKRYSTMGIYLFEWAYLKDYLLNDAVNPSSSHDFGKDVISAMLDSNDDLFAYRFQGYWRDVGNVDSLRKAHMDLLQEDNGFKLNNADWPIVSPRT